MKTTNTVSGWFAATCKEDIGSMRILLAMLGISAGITTKAGVSNVLRAGALCRGEAS